MADPKRPKAERAGILQHLTQAVLQDGDGMAACPILFDLLSPRWSGSTPTRQAGRLSLRAEGTQYRATIDCPTEGLMTVIYLLSIVQIAEQLESVLAAGKAVWTPNYDSQKKGRPVIDELI